MKSKWMLVLPALVLAALLAAALLVLRPGRAPVPQALDPRDGRDFVQAELSYDEGLRMLSGMQTIIAHNRSGEALGEMLLRLPANAQDGEACSVTGVEIGGERVQYEASADDPTVLTIKRAWAEGERVEISFSLMLRHPKAEGVPVVTLPYIAMYEDGAWRTDAYDGLADVGYAHAFDYSVTVDGVCAASMRGARDVSLALSAGCSVGGREVSGVAVTAVSPSSAKVRALLAAAKEALASLERAGLAYPFASLIIADAQAARADGAAYSGLIALDAGDDGEALLRRMTRLIARQIFGVYVESDPWSAPWLSESLASAAEMLAFEQRKGAAAYEARLLDEMEIASRVTRPHGVTVGAGTAHFGGDSEMTQVLRDQGGALLLEIRMAMGEQAFAAAISAYVLSCGGGIAEQADLEAALAGASGADWSGYLADGLSY